LALLGASSAHAKDATPDAAVANEIDAAFAAARGVVQVGPVPVTLRDQAQLNLPEGYVFIPPPEAERVMRALGNNRRR